MRVHAKTDRTKIARGDNSEVHFLKMDRIDVTLYERTFYCD